MIPMLEYGKINKGLVCLFFIGATALTVLAQQTNSVNTPQKSDDEYLDFYTNTNKLNELLDRELKKYYLKPSFWESSAVLTSSAGYRDNVTFSHYNIEASPFVQNSLELSLYRISTNKSQLIFYLLGDDLHYLKNVSVDKEQMLYGMAQIKQKLASGLQPGLTAQYIYQDRVIDLSGDPLSISSIHVVGHTFTTKPYLRYEPEYTTAKNLKSWKWIEFEFPITRQNYEAPLDDYWEFGPKLSLGLSYKTKPEQKLYSDVSFSFEYGKRAYDNMMIVDLTGVRLPETRLEYNQLKLQSGWRHYLDKNCYWRLYSKIGFLRNIDNGPGFYDYNRYTLSEQIQYRDKNWDARLELRVSLYEYDNQPVAYGSSTLRRISSSTLNLHIERKLIKKVKVFGEFEYERNNSTLTAEAYEVNTASGGFIVEF